MTKDSEEAPCRSHRLLDGTERAVGIVTNECPACLILNAPNECRGLEWGEMLACNLTILKAFIQARVELGSRTYEVTGIL